MQAITTTYHGPTNTKGSRITARCAGGSKTVWYDHALSLEANHRSAAYDLAHKMGWASHSAFHTMAHGTTHDGKGVHVFVAEHTVWTIGNGDFAK
jgi:hypothetical protein